MKIITDTELRATWSVNPFTEYEVEENTIVTPAARDFINEHGITLRVAQKDFPYRKMPYTPIPSCAAQGKYIDMQTGASMDEKPESMTHIRGNLLVPKNSPRIVFRGRLDSLEAKIMETQIIACDENYPSIAADLEELYLFVQAVLGAEVNETPLEEFHLLGMNSEEIRRVSHNVESELGIPHIIPSYKMGRLCVALNSLRTKVRETELAAIEAFCNGSDCTRPDIIRSLNRLSSCVYIIFCRKLAGYYAEGK